MDAWPAARAGRHLAWQWARGWAATRLLFREGGLEPAPPHPAGQPSPPATLRSLACAILRPKVARPQRTAEPRSQILSRPPRLFRIAEHASHHGSGWCAEATRRRRFDAKPSEQSVLGCSLRAPTWLARSSHRQTSSMHPMTDGSSPSSSKKHGRGEDQPGGSICGLTIRLGHFYYLA